jgi:hypothetical protein
MSNLAESWLNKILEAWQSSRARSHQHVALELEPLMVEPNLEPLQF